MSSGDLHEGDSVRVTALKKHGIIEEVLSVGRFRVAIGALKITCSRDEVTPAATPKTTTAFKPQRVTIHTHSKPPRSIDLHGLTVDQAIRQVDQWLDSVILSDLSHVKIVHGLGTGRVQSAIHHHLKTLKAVKHFKLNDGNPGETDVYL